MFLNHVVFLLLFFLYYCIISHCLTISYWWILQVIVLCFLVFHLEHSSCYVVPVEVLPSRLSQMHQSLGKVVLFHYKMSCMHLSWWLPLMFHTSLGMFFSRSSLSWWMSVRVVVYVLELLPVKFCAVLCTLKDANTTGSFWHCCLFYKHDLCVYLYM